MYEYKFVTVRCTSLGKIKEDYQKIISTHSEKGYELVSALPLYINKAIPSQYDFIFKKQK